MPLEPCYKVLVVEMMGVELLAGGGELKEGIRVKEREGVMPEVIGEEVLVIQEVVGKEMWVLVKYLHEAVVNVVLACLRRELMGERGRG